MRSPVRELPDVLVLGAGGTLGIAWLRGVLAGLQEASGLDPRECGAFVGTSAGAYVAASLAAGEPVGSSGRDPEEAPDAAAELERATDEHDVVGAAGGDAPDGDGGGLPGVGDPIARLASAGRSVAAGGARLAATAGAPLMPMALAATRPPGAVARAAALAFASRSDARPIDFGGGTDRFGAFDGRLRIVAVDRRRGTRVVFGAEGAPDAEVAAAVAASCAVPWLFSPVEIGGREYVDGGVWSLSNLDVAPAGRGARVLALLPTFRRPSAGGGSGGLGALRAAAQGAGLAEVGVLRARGAKARIVAPDAEATAAIGANPMDPRRRREVEAAGRAHGRRLGGA